MIIRRDENFLLTYYSSTGGYKFEWFEEFEELERFLKHSKINDRDIVDIVEILDSKSIYRGHKK